ncbi:MAG: cobalamin-dependent protein [Lachnospiraceae bacterium]|nr:cobalamin-dependent protein [Lachnospiraceae bacterium]
MLYEGIRLAVLDGKPRLVEKRIKEALDGGTDPRDILEKGLLAALDPIEEIQCDCEEEIAATLSYARAMKKGIECLETVLGESLYTKKCAVLIGTAVGDLHDMGKNIVALYFRASGFPVVDLGVDVSADQFIRALEAHPEAEVVCISTLLKTSHPEVKHMIQSIRAAMKSRKVLIMLGGGSVTEEIAQALDADCYTDSAVAAVKAVLDYAG